jgi:2-amino-4-hydroxy-6-hydroxymethyldihydropteridine diphosphokinase
MTVVRAYLGLGANLGNREGSLYEAICLLGELGTVFAQSSIIETEPWGVADQPRFLNMAVALDTGLRPLELLRAAKRIETRMGRVTTVRYGPRLIDIDLLLYGNVTMDSPELTLPHPRMTERDFVMIPLGELGVRDTGFARFPNPETRNREGGYADVPLRSDGPDGQDAGRFDER